MKNRWKEIRYNDLLCGSNLTQVDVPEDVAQQIQAIADKGNISFDESAGMIIRAALESQEKATDTLLDLKDEAAGMTAMAWALAGALENGPHSEDVYIPAVRLLACLLEDHAKSIERLEANEDVN